jgi:predicted PurR-regulated permease PerM
MTSLTIAVWVLVIEGFASVVLLFVFLVSTKRELENTLKETQSLLRTVNDKVNALSDELNNTLKNTTEITSNLKGTVRKTGDMLGATASALQFLPFMFILAQRGKTKEKNTLHTALINIGKFVFAGIQGFKIINELLVKGGKNNVRRERQ